MPAVMWSSGYGLNRKLCLTLVKDGSKVSNALFIACASGAAEIIKFLLERGMDVSVVEPMV